MNVNTIKVYKELMRNKGGKGGCISRDNNPDLWELIRDDEVRNELELMCSELDLEIIEVPNRLYIVPTLENDLVKKTNVDFRREIKASSEYTNKDLYLINYLSMFILFLFFNGEDNELCTKTVMLKADIIREFDNHCQEAVKKHEEGNVDYSDSFVKLATEWLAKIEGDADTLARNYKYGILKKVMLKFSAENLFDDDGDRIKPTIKLKDLMPFVLRKERVVDVNNWFEGE